MDGDGIHHPFSHPSQWKVRRQVPYRLPSLLQSRLPSFSSEQTHNHPNYGRPTGQHHLSSTTARLHPSYLHAHTLAPDSTTRPQRDACIRWLPLSLSPYIRTRRKTEVPQSLRTVVVRIARRLVDRRPPPLPPDDDDTRDGDELTRTAGLPAHSHPPPWTPTPERTTNTPSVWKAVPIQSSGVEMAPHGTTTRYLAGHGAESGMHVRCSARGGGGKHFNTTPLTGPSPPPMLAMQWPDTGECLARHRPWIATTD